MKARVKITVLSDNTVVARDARGEHGLAFWIDSPGARLLFDTGQGLVLADNARALRVDLGTVDAVVLSHGHYDHTGGLAGLLRERDRPVAVHAHPEVLAPRYRLVESGARAIGMSADSRETLLGSRCLFSPSRCAVEVAPGLWTTGEIPRRHPEEAMDEPFFRDPEGRSADLVPDDQALFMDTGSGTVVLLGCAHAGVINTLDHIRELTGGKPVRAVIGGLHLGAASAERVAWTIREWRRFESRLLVPLHCTGPQAFAGLWGAFPHSCKAGGVGSRFEF